MLGSNLDNLMPLKEAAKILPGKHWRTLRQWATSGVGGVVLRTVFVGRIRFTTRSDIERFIEQCTASHIRVQQKEKASSGVSRERIERGRLAMKSLGIVK